MSLFQLDMSIPFLGINSFKVAALTESLQVFLHAVELSPDVGHSKYMYLGQIHSGQEAVDYYTRGIQVLLSAMEDQEHTTVGASPNMTKQKLIYINKSHH